MAYPNEKWVNGWYGTPEYHAWAAMKARCTKPNHPRYKYYGARGITICERWLNSSRAFMEDMGPKPGPDYCLDRIDNDGNYEPANCRWVDGKVSRQNRRSKVANHRRLRRVLDFAKNL